MKAQKKVAKAELEYQKARAEREAEIRADIARMQAELQVHFAEEAQKPSSTILFVPIAEYTSSETSSSSSQIETQRGCGRRAGSSRELLIRQQPAQAQSRSYRDLYGEAAQKERLEIARELQEDAARVVRQEVSQEDERRLKAARKAKQQFRETAPKYPLIQTADSLKAFEKARELQRKGLSKEDKELAIQLELNKQRCRQKRKGAAQVQIQGGLRLAEQPVSQPKKRDWYLQD